MHISAGAVAAAFERIAADGRAGIWIELIDREQALAAARRVDEALAHGASLPLAGTTIAVKGNIDVSGHVTTAGCPAFGELAAESAPAVRALQSAGAVVIGITNLDQFATGLVGTRSPHGVCPNAFWPALISGGSSSGSAVAVAAGLVDLALGTDTAGSGRVPAAANGIVGLKPTRAAVSRDGIVPACRSIDCVSVFARTVADAHAAAQVLYSRAPDAQRAAALVESPPEAAPTVDRPHRVGVADPQSLDFDGDAMGPNLYRRTIDAVAATGVEVVTVDIAAFVATGRLLYEGAFVAERYASVGRFIDDHRDDVDPVVGAIIAASASAAGWEVFRDLAELERLRALTDRVWAAVDVLALPTVPRIPTAAEIVADPVGPNLMLGRYTNFVNLLDLCALTIPVGPLDATSDAPPPSLTLIAPAWRDGVLIELASRM